MREKIKIALIGAGGKMGTRTSNNLAKHLDDIDLRLVENSPQGIKSIKARGLNVTDMDTALSDAEVAVLAVPDTLIKVISKTVTPKLNSGSVLIILDPAAAVAKELDMRDDCTFAVHKKVHDVVDHCCLSLLFILFFLQDWY
ncbi:MAG: hypothetical protein AB9907_07855 [Flexilinea sp.]